MANLAGVVQVVENWAFLEGTVEGVQPSDTHAGFAVIGLDVERVDADEPFPNLFPEATGTVVGVAVPNRTIEELRISPGGRLRCRARKASPFQVFADPTAVTMLERRRTDAES